MVHLALLQRLIAPSSLEVSVRACSLYVPPMPYESVVLGLKFTVRLSDLTAADALRVECPTCSKVWHVGAHQLYLRFPPYMRFVQMESDMKCKACGRVGDLYWRIVRASFDPEANGAS